MLETTPQPEALAVPRVARLLGVCEKTVRRLIWCGRLPAFKVGRLTRVSIEDLRAYRQQARYRS